MLEIEYEDEVKVKILLIKKYFFLKSKQSSPLSSNFAAKVFDKQLTICIMRFL